MFFSFAEKGKRERPRKLVIHWSNFIQTQNMIKGLVMTKFLVCIDKSIDFRVTATNYVFVFYIRVVCILLMKLSYCKTKPTLQHSFFVMDLQNQGDGIQIVSNWKIYMGEKNNDLRYYWGWCLSDKLMKYLLPLKSSFLRSVKLLRWVKL